MKNSLVVQKRVLLCSRTPVWYLLELNQGHMDFQSIALPPELRYRGVFGTPYFLKERAKVRLFFDIHKFFCKKIQKKRFFP